MPIVAGFEVEAGEPSAASGVGIDIDGVTEVERVVGIFLGGVADDHDFAGLVGEGRAKLFVDHREGVLLGEGDVVFKVSVNKDVGLGFEVGLSATKKFPMRFGDIVETIGAIGIEGGTAAPGFEPMSEVGFVDARKEEFFLVVAVEKSDVVTFLEVEEEVDDSF